MSDEKTKRFRVVGLVTISVSTVVEATSKKSAIELARDAPMMSLCHQCSNGDDVTEWVTSGELDGTPARLRAEVES